MIIKTSISALRELVKTKQAYRTLLGRDEFLNLYKRYKTYDLRVVDSVTARGQTIQLGDVALRDTIKGKCVSLSPFNNEMGIHKTNMTFYNNEISWQNIVNRVNEWERSTIALKKVPRSIEDLSPKSLNKLFSAKYNPKRRIDKLGRPVTTIIDKKTQEPVEAYITHYKGDNGETFEMFLKNNTGKDERIGYRTFQLKPEERIISPGSMEAYANDRYEGIGTRLHQLAIERMIQNDYKAVEIYSLDKAFPFHYKSLFRVKPMPEKNFNSSLIESIKTKCKQTIRGKAEISDTEIDKCFVKAEGSDKFDISKALENFQKLFFQKRLRAGGDTPMILDGENLDYWKSLIAKQPILLNL